MFDTRIILKKDNNKYELKSQLFEILHAKVT